VGCGTLAARSAWGLLRAVVMDSPGDHCLPPSRSRTVPGVERTEFEALRDYPDKTINQDVKLAYEKHGQPLYTADNIQVQGTNVDLLINLSYVPEIRKFTINVQVRGRGPICRLCVNGQQHKDAGRTHKHDVRTVGCIGHLPHAVARRGFEGMSVADAWKLFCKEASIVHNGSLTCEGHNLTTETL
jgi:hypothetical protein